LRPRNNKAFRRVGPVRSWRSNTGASFAGKGSPVRDSRWPISSLAQKDPLHRVLPEEIDQIVTLARSEKYVDLSHRILAVRAWDQGLFQASFSTVYRVLKARNLMTARGSSGPHNGNSKPPVRKDLTGPNQRWCWDISYLPTFQKGEYLYLYLLLDEWSRKVIQWRIAWHQTAEESRQLLEGGLADQNILDLPEAQRPEVINDRGRQMKAKPIQRLCEDHGMPQLFARPRTPNDNPFIESAFSTVKRAPEYPGQFLDDAKAREYFSRYFNQVDGMLIPSGFTFDQFRIGPLNEKTFTHDMTLVKHVDVEVTAVRPGCSRASLIPTPEGPATIVDRRFDSGIPNRPPSYQNPASGQWPGMEQSKVLTKVQQAKDIQALNQMAQFRAQGGAQDQSKLAPHRSKIVLIVMCIFIAIPPIILLFRQKSKKS
jgi:putative transposase